MSGTHWRCLSKYDSNIDANNDNHHLVLRQRQHKTCITGSQTFAENILAPPKNTQEQLPKACHFKGKASWTTIIYNPHKNPDRHL